MAIDQIYSAQHFSHFTVISVKLSFFFLTTISQGSKGGFWSLAQLHVYKSWGPMWAYLAQSVSVQAPPPSSRTPSMFVHVGAWTKNPLLPSKAPHRLLLPPPYLCLVNINCRKKLLLVLTFRVLGVKICFLLLLSYHIIIVSGGWNLF